MSNKLFKNNALERQLLTFHIELPMLIHYMAWEKFLVAA